MIKLLDGKKIRNELLDKVKKDIKKHNMKLKLVVVTVGDNDASKVYVNNKRKACEKVGIEFEQKHIDTKEMDTSDLMTKVQNVISNLNMDDSVTGIIIQSPIEGLEKYESEIFNLVLKEKDVDAFGDEHVIDLYRNKAYMTSCTPSRYY